MRAGYQVLWINGLRLAEDAFLDPDNFLDNGRAASSSTAGTPASNAGGNLPSQARLGPRITPRHSAIAVI